MSFNRFTGRRALLCFAVCLVLGLIVVAWRARSRSNVAVAAGRAEALSQMAAVEAQLNQPLEAAQSLSLLARQNGGSIPNFARAAADLLTVFPGVTFLQLEPGGVVADIVPRTGHERIVGFNVMNDPAQRAGAQAAIQRRALVVAGPVLLPGGELGIVARIPIFQRGRDNRETFWGFTAASMTLSQAVGRARTSDLAKCGYNYLCCVSAAGQQRPLTVSSFGTVSSAKVEQRIRIPNSDRNAELCLVIQPRGGWFNKTKFSLELFGVFLVSALVGLLINTFESRQAVENTLAQANQQLAREAADRQRNQDDLRGVKDANATAQARQAELDHVRASLQQAHQTVAELQSRLMAAAQAEKDNAASVLVRLQQDQATIADLHAHLDATTKSAREAAEADAAKLRELETAHQQLTTRLAAAAHYEMRVAELTASLQQAEAETIRLREDLAAANRDQLTAVASVVSVQSAELDPVEPEKPKSERRRKSKALAAEPEAEEPDEKPMVIAEALPEHPAAGPVRATPEIKHNGTESEPGAAETAAPEPAVPAAETEAAVAAGTEAEHNTAEKPAKSRRKKVRRVDQLDLFGSGPDASESPRASLAETAAASPEPDATLSNLEPVAEPPEEKAEAPESAPSPEPAAAEVVIEETSTVAAVEAEPGHPAKAAPDAKHRLKALRDFVEEHNRTPEKIRDHLVQGDSAAAHKIIRELKEAAETAGATEVHAAATALGRAVEERVDPGATEFLWADLQKAFQDLAIEVKPASKLKTERPKPSRSLPPPPPLDIAELRSAVGMIVPLLMDQDPGAKDCLKDNRDTFRSTFSPEGYVDFDEAVKGSDYGSALEHLRKATRKHGLSV